VKVSLKCHVQSRATYRWVVRIEVAIATVGSERRRMEETSAFVGVFRLVWVLSMRCRLCCSLLIFLVLLSVLAAP
jgi:hypothetical protein